MALQSLFIRGWKQLSAYFSEETNLNRSTVSLNIISFLLSSDVSLTFYSFIMTTISFFNFITKHHDMMKIYNFLMISLGWTMAILDGTNKVNRNGILVQRSLIVIAKGESLV